MKAKIIDCLGWILVCFLGACLVVVAACVVVPQFRAHYGLLLAAPAIALGLSLGALLILFVLNSTDRS